MILRPASCQIIVSESQTVCESSFVRLAEWRLGYICYFNYKVYSQQLLKLFALASHWQHFMLLPLLFWEGSYLKGTVDSWYLSYRF